MSIDFDQTQSTARKIVRGAIVIGASTGGPEAVTTVLSHIPADTEFPILVAQHLPNTFAESFTQRLTKASRLPVVTLSLGQHIEPSVIYVAPGGFDARINRLAETNTIVTHMTPSNEVLSPSIDVLMKSAATAFGAHTLGIILTGMGSDGLEGIRAIKQAGGISIVQNEATSVVYGMAKEVVNAHLADACIPLDSIAWHAVHTMRQRLESLNRG